MKCKQPPCPIWCVVDHVAERRRARGHGTADRQHIVLHQSAPTSIATGEETILIQIERREDAGRRDPVLIRVGSGLLLGLNQADYLARALRAVVAIART
jgi:hypothetical protein